MPFSFRKLAASMGTFKSVWLIGITLFLWGLSVMEYVDHGRADLLMWMSAGLAAAVVSLPAVRIYGRTYRVLIRVLGLVVIFGALYARQLPKIERDQIGGLIIFAASLYCHSIMFAFGNLDIPEIFPDETE